MKKVIFIICFILSISSVVFAQAETQTLPSITGTVNTADAYTISRISFEIDNANYVNSIIEIEISIGKVLVSTDPISAFSVFDNYEKRQLFRFTIAEIRQILDNGVTSGAINNGQRTSTNMIIKNHVIDIRDFSYALKDILVTANAVLNFPTKPVTKVTP